MNKKDLAMNHNSSYQVIPLGVVQRTQGCFCFAGIAVEEGRDLPPLLVKANVQTQAYACFTCESTEPGIQFILEHLFHTWLPHSGLHELPDTVIFENRGLASWLIYWPFGTQTGPAAPVIHAKS
jgi:predicted transcriptional regulator YdeE